MNSNYALVQALVFALAGWVATCYCIVHSRIKAEKRRWLIIPLWFVWMIVAIGGPVFQGVVSLVDAGSAIVGLTAGMAMMLFFNAHNARRSR